MRLLDRLFQRPNNIPTRGLGFSGASGAAVRVAQVIVYVNSPMEAVRDCLAAAMESFEGRDFLVVCDSREESTGAYLARFAAEHACRFVQNLDPLGFQRSVAKGIRMSRAQYLVIVDSDVVPAAGCLRELVEHLSAAPLAEVAVPLLDVQLFRYLETSAPIDPVAASFVRAANPELVAAALDSVSRGVSFASTLDSFPGHPCFAMRRSAFSKLAAWEIASEKRTAGAKEEGLAGVSGSVSLLVVPGSYASYRSPSLPEIYRAALQDQDSSPVSGAMHVLQSVLSSAARVLVLAGKRVLFLLPSPGGGGGAHCVVQEVIGLRRCGLDARIANLVSNKRPFEQNYPEAGCFCFYHSNDDELLEVAGGPAIVVATSYASVSSLKSIVDRNPAAVPLYYVQDYEPWFYPEHDPRHAAAKASYTLVPKARAFAKTEWLCRTVHRMAGIDVARVAPGLDRSLYNSLAVGRERSGPVAITSMIRPSSARRNPRGTLNLLRRIKRKYGSGVDIRIFGCADEELDQLDEARGFDFVNFGELKRAEVAGVLRGADIFVDMSTSQAFGCTGLEAMAVGCASVLPRGSGVEEYATDEQNCLLVDTANGAEAAAAVERLIADNRPEGRFRKEALRTGLRYSIRTAVWSLLLLFGDACDEINVVADKG